MALPRNVAGRGRSVLPRTDFFSPDPMANVRASMFPSPDANQVPPAPSAAAAEPTSGIAYGRRPDAPPPVPTPQPRPQSGEPATSSPADAAAAPLEAGGGSGSAMALAGLTGALRDPGAGWQPDPGFGGQQPNLGTRSPNQSLDILRQIVSKRGKVY